MMSLDEHALLRHADAGLPWPDDVPAAAFSDLAAAYRQQAAVRALRVARGDQARGYKIGFTNRQIWDRYRVWAPIWGPVWRSTLAFCDGAGRLSLAGTCQPRIEPEIVFGLKATPPATLTPETLFEAIEWLAPGFETVQSHRPGWRFTAPETVADGALHARLLVGPRVPLRDFARNATALHKQLAAATVVLSRDGEPQETGRGLHVLDSPLMALLHFVQALRQTPDAVELQPGDVVTTGTWTDAWPVQAGQTWQAQFDAGLPALQIAYT